MSRKKISLQTLAGILTLADLVVVVFAFVGGMNMFNVNVPAAVGTLAGGSTLAVLSAGLWTANRRSQVIRFVLYSVLFLAAGVSLAIVSASKGLSGLWPMPVIVILLFVIVCLSALHLRLRS